MKTLHILILLAAATAFSFSKSKEIERKLDRAETLYRGGNYHDALRMYLDVYTADSSNHNVCYKLGVCYLKAGGDHRNALKYLRKAAQATTSKYEEEDYKKERKAPVEAHKLLGDAQHLNYQFDQAIESYEKYRSAKKLAKDEHREIERRIAMCRTAKELMQHPAQVKIVNLGKSINSSFADYSPRLSADQQTMIFTSRRPENIGGKTYDGGQYFEDIWMATKKDSVWQPAVNMGWPINTVANEAAIGISADGQEILIYKDDYGDGNIYSSRLEGDKWTVPTKLNSNINSQFWEPAAFLSADGQTLYFVSDRPGGYGGTDIYKSKKMSNGEWGKAINLGPKINSPYDEHSPYIHPDGVTLFFSSKGHKTMGGYDVFFSHTVPGDEREWVEPVNVGFPINTPGDDAFYMVSPDKRSAYYSTYSYLRGDGMGEKDNYMVTFSDVKESPLALVKGTMIENDKKMPKNMVITVTDNETNEVEGVYRPNSKTGNYLFILTPGKSHNITYQADGKLFYSENRYISKDKPYVEDSRNINLPDITVGAKVVLNNIFFDFDDSRLKPFSQTELDRVYTFLNDNPNVSVEVAGYSDSKGNDSYNLKLSQERARAVADYLHHKGIEKSRLRPVGYGEEKSSAGNADNVGRETDRRVELHIIAVK